MVPPRGRSKENVRVQASARAVYASAESPSFIDEGFLVGYLPFGTETVNSGRSTQRVRRS